MIDEAGEQLGVMTPLDALNLAKEKQLDLVEISPNAQPPVCRIMNYGKYIYQLKKKANVAKKNQKTIQVKEVKFRPKTDNHDYEFKKKNILRFLEEGDKVNVAEKGVVEGHPKMEGNHMFVIFSNKK